MIASRKEYLFYLEADRVALGINRKSPRFFGDEVWRFQRLLRKAEYLTNCKKGLFWRLYCNYILLKLHYLGKFLGFTIPINVFDAGLSIAHHGTIIVNKGTRVGKNCRLHVCVNIGTQAGFSFKAPVIGDNVYIGPGAKLYGEIFIADGIAIGANAVVNKTFSQPNISIAGVPARKISEKGSDGLIIKATEFFGE